MRHFLILSLALALALSAGCASARRNMKSYTSDSFPVISSHTMIQDVVERLFSTYPPGQTAIFLAGKGDFALSLEEALRNRGYSIMPEPGEGTMTVAWTVDRLDEESDWYLIVNLSDGYRFSRVYRDNGQTVEPIGGMSQGIF